VIHGLYLRISSLGKHLSISGEDHAAQLVEFAVSLPLLVLFVVGIFDFSGAFNLKEKLTNVARDAARVAAADPFGDIGASTVPVSVTHAFKVVDSYLNANQINDCGLATKVPTSIDGGITWAYDIAPAGNPPCGIRVVIKRGYSFPVTGSTVPTIDCPSQGAGGQLALVGTCVSIRYAYPWKFGRAASLLGRNAALPTDISAVAVALNEN
jgi:hypothetical protein